MLKYNFERAFRARGIEKPYRFLRQSGVYSQLASKIHNNAATTMKLKTLEHLCLTLHCTPNDVMEWIPDAKDKVADDHPMTKLMRNDKIFNLTQTLNSVPLDKLERLEKIINNEIQNIQNET
ncbi:MAG: helix-turn-helix transcriptional regulator [Bacteroidales bacterium]|nr:helix-turn-helix transcriptional regulator [Bacteroidales bacterium]